MNAIAPSASIMPQSLTSELRPGRARHAQAQFTRLFGMLARGLGGVDSALDLAVAGDRPLRADGIVALIDNLALACGWPIELVDPASVAEPLLAQILCHAVRVTDHSVRLGVLLSHYLTHKASCVSNFLLASWFA